MVQGITTVQDFEGLLRNLTGIESGELSPSVRQAIDKLLGELSQPKLQGDYRESFYQMMNSKLNSMADNRRVLYKILAREHLSLNAPEKRRLNSTLDAGNAEAFISELCQHGVSSGVIGELLETISIPTEDDSRGFIVREANRPSKLRKIPDRDIVHDLFNSAAGALVFSLWDREFLYRCFGASGNGDKASNYLEFLETRNPELFGRDLTLWVAHFQPRDHESREAQRSCIEQEISSAYSQLSNHGFFALVVDCSSPSVAWQSVNDATLYGEHFMMTELKQMFFRHKQVAAETKAHIGPELNVESAEFPLLYEGFTYRDLLVIKTADGANIETVILLMQKNQRDETKIPCPACRSMDIEGNSYPSLGVRSYECRNVLCPSRSLYNRGNRYSFKSVIQQAAMDDPRNRIPDESISYWRRDVVDQTEIPAILEMLVRHYSMVGDGVAVRGVSKYSKLIADLGRRPVFPKLLDGWNDGFWDSSYFDRFPVVPSDEAIEPMLGPSIDSEVLLGDSREVLARVPESSFDLAVTSPPYYNAREYSKWPNLYAYLYDMGRNGVEVFRTLKPGALYAYNIFDYFDNDRTITFSLMGKRRLTLAAHISAVFERIGFEIAGVVIWDKGEIEGKRGFNGGNDYPYYQAPFNCWEHVLIFRKPAGEGKSESDVLPFSSILNARPVIKMIQGTNVLGHTAPFPVELPMHFLDASEKNGLVVDPYAGSGTTGLACLAHERRYFLVEQNPEYFALIERRICKSRQGELQLE